MQETPRSSFIPRQTGAATPIAIKRRRSLHLFSFSATVLLVASLIAAAGAYAYNGYVEKKLDEKRLELTRESEKYGPDKMNDVREFNRQLLAAEYLLDRHISPSLIFDQLELSTMQRVQFTSFLLEYDPSDLVALSVDGGTEEFKTVALQALTFGDQSLLESGAFTDLASGVSVDPNDKDAVRNDSDKDHKVSFKVAGSVAPSLLLYRGQSLPTMNNSYPSEVQSDDETPPQESAQ